MRRSVANLVFIAVVSALLLCGCAVRSPQSLEKAVRPQDLNVDSWIALGHPSEEHKELERFVGEWRVRIASRGDPTQSPLISEGSSSISWVLGNRFVEEYFSGKLAEQPYEGRGFFGFDNTTRRYVSVWMESVATGVVLAYGLYRPEEQTFDFEGTVYDPLLGRTKQATTKIHFVSPDEFTIAFIEQTSAGVEFAAFELAYQRKQVEETGRSRRKMNTRK